MAAGPQGDIVPLPEGHDVKIRSSSGELSACSTWSEVFVPREAEALTTFEGGMCSGLPAATRRSVGAGAAYHLSTRPSASFMRNLLTGLCRTAAAEGFAAPLGVEVARRSGPGSDFTFYLNHRAEPVALEGVPPGVDLLSGESTVRDLRLEPLGVAVVRHADGKQL